MGNWGVVGGSAVGGRVDATFPNLAKFPGSFSAERRESVGEQSHNNNTRGITNIPAALQTL